MTTVLATRSLVKRFGGLAATNDVTLELARGARHALIGPNGAGKTTLMRILSGLLEPTSGQISLDGQDVLAEPQWLWARLGYLPQDFGFYPHLTGEQMLTYLLKLKGVEAPGGLKNLCAELLDRVNLSYAAKRKVKTYSGGMRQRLGIAQAIAGDPRLIIVDEPTAGLDPEERLRFYRLLAELAADRIVLLSTHIVEDVAVLCPRFAVIRKGRLLAQTSPSEARTSISGRIFEGRVAADELEEIRQRMRVTQAVLVEGRNRVRIFEPEGQAPAGFEPVPATLEDAYLLLMQDAQLPSHAVPNLP
ncbi:MAG TPA: ATP-binding cassette domain-containing protein [Thermoanaerobaculia bacterium]|nr:ATP-binding cassette domain-containing protein [Thermoanaerobaculia bacterium]